MGFSRADHYFGYFVINIAVVGTLLYLGSSKCTKIFPPIFIVSIAIISNWPTNNTLLSKKPFEFGIDYHIPYQQRVSDAYSMFKLPDSFTSKIGDKTVDVYPYNNEYMFANKLNYHYRPNFQNYMTLTPRLDNMNLDFFDGDDKPEFVIWTGGINCNNNPSCNVFDGFDEKFALNEDPLTTSAILLNYKTIATTTGKDGNKVSLMSRLDITNNYHPQHISSQQMQFNEWYKVPQVESGVVKLIPNLQFSIYGRLKNMLFRGDILYMSYKFSDGSVKRYRLNILNSQSGIWISPFITDFSFKGQVVTEVMLETTGKHYFLPKFNADWIDVPIKQVENGSINSPLNLKRLNVQIDPNIKVNGNIDSIQVSSPSLNLNGWVYLIDQDAAINQPYLILTNTETMDKYYFILNKSSRGDISNAFSDGVNLNMSGFAGSFNISNIPYGKYNVELYVRGIDGYGNMKSFNQLEISRK